jgi:hypothetical protein
MITERAIINALIVGATFILIPFIISSTLTVDYAPVLFFGGLTALIVAFFVVKEKLCVFPLLGTGITGALNFLPLPLDASHIAAMLLICYYVTGYVVIRQKRIKLGKTMFFWPILIITAILLYHNHSLHVGAAGDQTEGTKPAILMYLIILGYFCGINVTSPSVDFLSKIPFWYVVCTGLSSVPYLLSTYIPGLAPYLYSVTSSVNVDAYVDSLNGSGNGADSTVGRLSVLGPMGSALQLYLLCNYPIGTWLRPERWWVLGLSLICVILAVSSGYRNTLFGFMMVTMVGAWAYYAWKSLFLPAGVVVAVLVFIIASSNDLIHVPLNRLPVIAQRTLSFLPGDWDESAVQSADSSNFFRKNIQDVYIKEYLSRSPLIGTGYNINKTDFDYYSSAMATGGGDKAYFEAKLYIEGKLFHTGWMSLYDIVGIIGGLAFIALGWNEIWLVYHFLFGPKADRRSSLYPLYVWILCNLVTMMVSFFTVFGDFGQTFANLCVYGVVLSHLADLESTRDIPVAMGERKTPFELTGAGGGAYGYGGYGGYGAKH